MIMAKIDDLLPMVKSIIVWVYAHHVCDMMNRIGQDLCWLPQLLKTVLPNPMSKTNVVIAR